MSDVNRFVILSRSRSGSNMLLSMLNSHPQIHAQAEIAKLLQGRSMELVLQEGWPMTEEGITHVGFKTFYYHPLDGSPEAFWDLMETNGPPKVIHLRRKNSLRIAVSRRIAEKTNIWRETEKKRLSEMPAREKQVSFQVDELKAQFRQIDTWKRQYRERLKAWDVIEISYEKMVRSPKKTQQQLCDFLELPFIKPEIATRKQNAEPLAELVVNYEELKRAFQETRWAKFFEDA